MALYVIEGLIKYFLFATCKYFYTSHEIFYKQVRWRVQYITFMSKTIWSDQSLD